jgi:SAM-dependent methyltransferase
MHANTAMLFTHYARPYFTPGARVLEVGPDSNPSGLRCLVQDSAACWDTADFPGQFAATYLLTEDNRFPIPDASYDIVLSANVIEHVRKPWLWLREVARVCKPGGLVITIVPVSWPFHECPIDCWRISPDGMKALYQEAGLDVITAVCASLESNGRKRVIPGRSRWHQPWYLRHLYRLASYVGLPMEYAYDTIGIGRKPVEARPSGEPSPV